MFDKTESPFILILQLNCNSYERHSEKKMKFSTYTDLKSILLIFTASYFL